MSAAPLPFDEITAMMKKKISVDAEYQCANYVVGAGGFGRVYRCVHRASQRIVAIKQIVKSKILAYHREVSVLTTVTALGSPYLPTLLDYGSDTAAGNFAIVTDFVQGMTLGDIVYAREKAVLASEPSVRVMRQIMLSAYDALELLHRSGVVHRDVKPDNIIVRGATFRSGTGGKRTLDISGAHAGAVLIDFGGACFIASSTPRYVCKTYYGTPVFTNPHVVLKVEEQRLPLTPADLFRADVWALAYAFASVSMGGYASISPKDATSFVQCARAILQWLVNGRAQVPPVVLYRGNAALNDILYTILFVVGLDQIPMASDVVRAIKSIRVTMSPRMPAAAAYPSPLMTTATMHARVKMLVKASSAVLMGTVGLATAGVMLAASAAEARKKKAGAADKTTVVVSTKKKTPTKKKAATKTKTKK
jgi:serine/threonine protein kinase